MFWIGEWRPMATLNSTYPFDSYIFFILPAPRSRTCGRRARRVPGVGVEISAFERKTPQNARIGAFPGVKKKSTARKPFVSAALRTAQVALGRVLVLLRVPERDFEHLIGASWVPKNRIRLFNVSGEPRRRSARKAIIEGENAAGERATKGLKASREDNSPREGWWDDDSPVRRVVLRRRPREAMGATQVVDQDTDPARNPGDVTTDTENPRKVVPYCVSKNSTTGAASSFA